MLLEKGEEQMKKNQFLTLFNDFKSLISQKSYNLKYKKKCEHVPYTLRFSGVKPKNIQPKSWQIKTRRVYCK